MGNPPQIEIRDHRERDWFWSNNGVIDWYGPIVGADSIAVYMALAKYSNPQGESWPSYNTLARLLKLSRPTVIKCMRKLEVVNLVAKSERQQSTKEGGKMADSNKYILLSVKPLDEPSKARLLGLVKEIDHRPSKPDLPDLVNGVNHPSKRRLPKQDSWNKTQGNKTQRERTLAPAVKVYREAFPHIQLTDRQESIIVNLVGDVVEKFNCWRATIEDYEGSPHWKPENLGNIRERFDRKWQEWQKKKAEPTSRKPADLPLVQAAPNQQTPEERRQAAERRKQILEETRAGK